MLRHEAVWALNKRQKATQPCKVLSLISAPWLWYKLHPIYQIKQYPMWNSTKHHKCFTSIKSSSAPLKRKIIGWGGAQPESTTSLATSSSDAANRKKKTQPWYIGLELKKCTKRTYTWRTVTSSRGVDRTVKMCIHQYRCIGVKRMHRRNTARKIKLVKCLSINKWGHNHSMLQTIDDWIK